MSVQTGLDQLVEDNFQQIAGRNIIVVCNQASIDRRLEHISDIFCEAHRKGLFQVRALLGPQHGLWGHTQDNMIEWQGYADRRLKIPVFSLYGEHRKPTRQMLKDVDLIVVDMQDVGAKYYTFIWTLAHCMEAAIEAKIDLMVLDRPNPLGGVNIEGTADNRGFRSFVGLHPIAVRHAMSIGEVGNYLKQHFYPDCDLQVIEMKNYRRSMYFDDTGLPWAMPSPNMPTLDTAIVYPGMCLLEATNLSEGRGTTRPFELLGAPWLDSWEYVDGLNRYDLPGVFFRPLEFQPTFHKHAQEVCGGCMMHVTDREKFLPFLTGIAVIREAIAQHQKLFQWKQPPYEYEYEKMPFDILVGNDWLRKMLEKKAPLKEMQQRWEEESHRFTPLHKKAQIYQ